MTRLPIDKEAGKARGEALAKDFTSAQKGRTVMAILGFGKKKDTRPVDVGLAALVGKSDSELIEWWKQRLELIAQVPSDIARVGALTPQLRELSRIESADERKRLTRARIIALSQLPQDKRQIIAEARKKAWDVDRDVLDADEKIVAELLPQMDASVRAAYPQAGPRA
jgi:hypothetical protein